MTIREKLIDLLKVPIHPRNDADPAEVVADYLLDNGVTVQQWVSVSKRLPREDETNDFGEVIVRSGHEVYTAVFSPCHERFSRHRFPLAGVTHWMPLPEPPKEERAWQD